MGETGVVGQKLEKTARKQYRLAEREGLNVSRTKGRRSRYNIPLDVYIGFEYSAYNTTYLLRMEPIDDGWTGRLGLLLIQSLVMEPATYPWIAIVAWMEQPSVAQSPFRPLQQKAAALKPLT